MFGSGSELGVTHNYSDIIQARTVTIYRSLTRAQLCVLIHEQKVVICALIAPVVRLHPIDGIHHTSETSQSKFTGTGNNG